MTTASEGFLAEMPSVTSVSSTEVSVASSPPTSPSSVVVINGLTTAIPEGKAVVSAAASGVPHLKDNGSSPGSASSSPDVRSPTPALPAQTPLYTIVPSLQRVVATTTAAGSLVTSTSSSIAAKSTIVAPSDSPQIIVGSESDGSLDSNSNGNVGVPQGTVNISVGGTYVQYVDATPEPLYPPTNGQMAYYTVSDGTMYATAPPYYTAGTTPVTYSSEATNSPSAHIVAGGANTYIIQDVEAEALPQHVHPSSRHSPATDGGVYMVGGGGSGGSSGGTGASNPSSTGSPSHGGGSANDGGSSTTLDADAQANIAHATRVSPATVQWLLDNYETAEGVSLPRSTLYNHYIHHCNDHNLDPVNSASFGKLIRSVFMGLRTRRLGTRGNSKYHYYGIRVKPNSLLNNLSEDGSTLIVRQQDSSNSQQRTQQSTDQSQQQSQQQPQAKSVSSSSAKSGELESHVQSVSEASPQTLHNQQYLGDFRRALPLFPEIHFNGSALPSGLSMQHLETFRTLYQDHCESILDSIYNLQFHLVETLWRKFWGSANNNNNVVDKNASDDISDDEEGELTSKLPSNIIQILCRFPPVLEFMKDVDYQLYQNLVEVLIPDVLRSIPSTLTQSIRNFAKSLEGWLTSALIGYPQEAVHIKIGAVASLAQTLRRYTSLNHLAQAARAVLQNASQITQMLSDLNRVDFHNVQEQASWVCQCDVELVERLEEDFKRALQQQNNLEQWAEWLQQVVDKILTPHSGLADFTKHARQFLLKWSFYSSMVIRDLTLRSAASFGSFHLIRLLYDEYMFYLVEHKVAESLDLSPIAVMSQYLETSKSNRDEHQLNKLSPILNGEETTLQSSFKRPKFEES